MRQYTKVGVIAEEIPLFMVRELREEEKEEVLQAASLPKVFPRQDP